MNKKNTIIILILIAIILVIITLSISKNEKETDNTGDYSYKILTEEERKQSRKNNIEGLVTLLKSEGLALTNKQDCVSDFFEEEGYSYKADDQIIEIYEIEEMKLNTLINRTEGSFVVKINTKGSRAIEAICFKNIVIVNAKDNLKQNIIKILEKL